MKKSFKDKTWYAKLVIDSIFYQIPKKEEAFKKILHLIRNASGEVYYENGVVYYRSADDVGYIDVPSCSLIKVSDDNNNTKDNEYSLFLAEEELIEELIYQIRVSMHMVVTLIHINNIIYYHYILKKPYIWLNNHGHYDKGRDQFYKDRQEAYELLLKAFKLDINPDEMIEIMNN